ncbi:hypothetical protein [Pseudomonas amygdali]|uniref:Uncharacterized protein n=1 Tax=Pseudomonas amygdali pv. lachrymans str. M301315 TaxID=629260 RepID=A0AAD0PWD1_PSEAV|nr:hypothetical protein [Pseudomonas amygdali]AXH59958.1 hypothetical protein PLA107_032550 [Pseudomonas amygdali pv. lachrymans str. M301315]
MYSDRKAMPGNTLVLFIILSTATALLFFVAVAIFGNFKSDKPFFEHLAKLESKSQAHGMILNNFRKCMQDEHEPESSCITNTILLAEVNGYKNNIAEVFRDAGIPRK